MAEALGSFDISRAATAIAPPRVKPARPIKVIHLFKYFRPDFTGDGLYLEKLIPILEQEGVHSDVAADVTRPSPTQTRAHLFGHASTKLLNPLLLLWFALNAWRYDVAHLHSAIDRHFLYPLIARLSGCRVVQSCTLDDGIHSLVHSYRPRFQGLIRRLCSLINDVIAISPALYEDSKRETPINRVHLIPQGVTIPESAESLRAQARQRFNLPDNAVAALFVGGLCPRKDVRFLVDNHPAHLPELHLILVGPDLDTAYVDALRHAIATSPAASRIHLAGFMSDPAPAYRAADLFVFASHKEGCPNVVLEAMSHGLPVLSRNLPDTTDAVIDHGRTGLLFQTEAEYAAHITHLARNHTARAAMGNTARTAVATAYDLRAIAARYAAIYRKAA